MLEPLPEVGVQTLDKDAEGDCWVCSRYLAEERFQALPLKQLHKPLPLHQPPSLFSHQPRYCGMRVSAECETDSKLLLTCWTSHSLYCP